jgi:hypothetical protein
MLFLNVTQEIKPFVLFHQTVSFTERPATNSYFILFLESFSFHLPKFYVNEYNLWHAVPQVKMVCAQNGGEDAV